MKFGIFDHVDDSGLPLARHFATRLRFVEALDQSAFESYHVAEHHGTPLGLAPSPNVYLAAVAQRTRRLRFGPMVYVASLYHPLRLAEEICMLDQMSEGRLLVGLGRGGAWPEQVLYGVDRTSAAGRYAEAVEVLLAALQSPSLNFRGEHFRFEGFPMVLRPWQQPRPPLWYGIGNPDSAVWAAANDANIVSLQPVASAARCLSRYREEWAKRGRDERELPALGIARHIVVAETDAEAQRIARGAYSRWRESMSHLWERQNLPFPLEATLPRDWDSLQSAGQGIAGTPDRVRDYIAAQTAGAGANFVMCQMIFGSMPCEDALHSVELFSRAVAPHFL